MRRRHHMRGMGLLNPFAITGPDLTNPVDLAGIAAITNALGSMSLDGQASAFDSAAASPGGAQVYRKELMIAGGIGFFGAAVLVGGAWYFSKKKR